jgi:hypothetical protein
MRERISRTNRWNFWRSCPRQAWRRNSLGAQPGGQSWSATLLGTHLDALFADEAHVCPPPIRPKQHHVVFFRSAALHPTHAALRQAHLKYHLFTIEVLTPAQIQRYAELRGYKEGNRHPHGRH